MRKVNAFLLVLSVLFLSACSANEEQVYVKNMFLLKSENNYTLAVVYYDFQQQEEKMITSEYEDKDINNLGIKAMKDKNYSFRLCENIFISPDIFYSDIDKAITLINNLRVSLNAELFCYPDTIHTEEINYSESPGYCLYDITVTNGKISGVFPVIYSNGKQSGAVIVKQGVTVDVMSQEEFAVYNIVFKGADSCKILFRDNSMWADIENIMCSYKIRDNILCLDISFSVKDYKGVNSSVQSRNIFNRLLASHICNTVYDLCDKLSVSQMSDVYWYAKQQGTECKSLNINTIIR